VCPIFIGVPEALYHLRPRSLQGHLCFDNTDQVLRQGQFA